MGRWQDGAVEKVKFRHNAMAVLGLVMLCGSIALATSAWYFAPVLLIPIVLIVWALRAGTDVDPQGVRVRALLGSRHLTWPQIGGFVPQRGKVLAMLANGRAVPLPAVTPADLPRLLRAGGQSSILTSEETGADVPAEPDDETDTDAGTPTH
jgi:hypothetical protein